MSVGYRDAGAPTGRVIELAPPNVLGLLGTLTLPAGLLVTLSALIVGRSAPLAIGLMILLLGLALIVIGRARSVEYRLVLDPRGVFLVDRSGAVEGLLGDGPFTLTPGHYIYRAKYAAYEKQCVAIGNRFSIGTNAPGTVRYRVPVPTLPIPRFCLTADDWDTLVEALPALRSLQ